MHKNTIFGPYLNLNVCCFNFIGSEILLSYGIFSNWSEFCTSDFCHIWLLHIQMYMFENTWVGTGMRKHYMRRAHREYECNKSVHFNHCFVQLEPKTVIMFDYSNKMVWGSQHIRTELNRAYWQVYLVILTHLLDTLGQVACLWVEEKIILLPLQTLAGAPVPWNTVCRIYWNVLIWLGHEVKRNE